MTKYKIIGENSDLVRVVNGNGSVTTFGKGSLEYDQFIQDVKEQGIGIVEGPDIVTPDYKESRLSEYPDIREQLDQLYWDLKNGRLDTGDWIQNITKIKLKHSKSNTGTTTVGELPQWVITEGTGNFP